MSRRTIEIETLAEFDRRIARTHGLNGWMISSVDLRERGPALFAVDPHGAVFLGCRLAKSTESWLRAHGALIFPTLPDLPFDPYQPALYRPPALLGLGADAGGDADVDADASETSRSYADSPDAQVYAWARSAASRSMFGTLASSLHDHAIGNALDDLLAGVPTDRVVGVMGGHALTRDEVAYAETAQLGARLASQGRVVLTGGGPGAMEAANLGAFLGQEELIEPAVEILAAEPTYTPSVDRWLGTADQVRRRWPRRSDAPVRSVGIPTWFYGHEPPNAFPDAVAKYFRNALREDTLLHRCRGGVVFIRGAAGTVQEVFTAATEDYYVADETQLAPLILVGVDYWRSELPAWPLLQRLGRGRGMATAVHCVDTVAEAAELIMAC